MLFLHHRNNYDDVKITTTITVVLIYKKIIMNLKHAHLTKCYKQYTTYFFLTPLGSRNKNGITI